MVDMALVFSQKIHTNATAETAIEIVTNLKSLKQLYGRHLCTFRGPFCMCAIDSGLRLCIVPI